MSDKATPRPWVANKVKANVTGHAWFILVDRDGKGPVAELYSPGTPDETVIADANLIVRAVNAHDALVESVKDLMLAVTRLRIEKPVYTKPYDANLYKANAALELAGETAPAPGQGMITLATRVDKLERHVCPYDNKPHSQTTLADVATRGLSESPPPAPAGEEE